LGEPFQLEVELYATRSGRVSLHLLQGNVPNQLDASRELRLEPGVTRAKFQTVVHVPGEVVYKLLLSSQGEDSIADNNQDSVRVVVAGRPSVLYVEGQPARANYLTRALSAQQFDVDLRQASALPTNAAEFARFDFLILSDVPATAVDATRQGLLERYVSEGGGFLFAGGEAGYQLGGWRNTTVERLLPVRMESSQQKDNPGVALALVIDRSGSMSGLPLEMAKAACEATVTTLSADDQIEVIAFDGAPTRYVRMQPARYVARIQGEIARIQVGGGTSIFPALDAAYQDLSVVQARRKHVILLTDGRAENQGIRDLVQAMLSDSITVTTVGLGDGVDSDFLRMISENGGGRYHHAPDPSHLPRIFTRETELVAPKSSHQDWFPVTQTARADFLSGVSIASAPLLHGYVATQLKPPPAQQILTHENGDPILSRWRVGLGYSLAWTSDLKNGWAVDWVRWPEFSKFVGQLVREHMRKRHQREIPMRVEVRGDSAVAIVDAFTRDERFENGLTSRLKVSGADAASTRDYAFRQVAPGRYEAELPLDQYGSFALTATHLREDQSGVLQKTAASFARFSNPYPREYARFEPDLSLLSELSLRTNGTLAPPVAKLFLADGEEVIEKLGLWPRLLPWMLGCFFLDLLLRRVRWFDRAFRGT
jgi:Ca-activated chloride channel homolog